MSRILGAMVLAMAGLCLVIVLLGQRIFREMRHDMDIQNTVSDYFRHVGAAQPMLLSLFTDPGEASLRACEEQLAMAVSMAERMAEHLDDPLFVDHKYLAEAYQEAGLAFLGRLANGRAGEAMEAYLRTERIHGLIENQLMPLTAAKEAIAQGNMRALSGLWGRQVAAMLAFVCIICAALHSVGMRFIRRTITPITRLTKQAEGIAKGKPLEGGLESASPSHDDDETTILTAAFALMSATIRRQMEELEGKLAVTEAMHALEVENMRMQVSLTKTEMMFMQSLINPHFLFNCMNVLTSLAYIEKAPRVNEAAELIAQFLRQSMRRLGRHVTVQMEMEHIRQYIAIQEMRFGERISFLARCDEASMEARIPAMILQPLVENAIVHGVGAYLGGGRVSLAAERRAGPWGLRIAVEDNGPGLARERIDQILEDLNQPFAHSKASIGLRSVLLRLRETYAEAFDFSFESEPGLTRVELLLPFEHAQSDSFSDEAYS